MSLRKSKTTRSRLLAPLGIVMLLVLIAAPNASAEGRFRAGSYAATVQGTATSIAVWSIAGTVTVSCGQMSLHGTLAAASRTVELQPSYATCSSNSGYEAAVKTNGCEYAWEIESLGSGTAGGAQTISCAPGQAIEITRSLGGVERCRYAIAPQGPSKSIAFANKGSGATSKVHAEPSINMTAEVVYGGGAICGGSTGSTKNVSYSGGVDLSALNGGGESTGLSVGGAGLYLTGEASENPANQPKFASETGSEPLTVQGSVTAGKPHAISFQGIRTVQCDEIGLTGQLVAPAASLRLVPSYDKCAGNGSTTVVFDTNSCYYDLSLLNAGPPYAGNLALGCSEPGDGIEAHIWAAWVAPEPGKELCIIKLGQQSGLGSVGLETTGSGFDRKIAVDLNLTGVQFTRLKGTAVNCGPASSSKGTYSGGSTLIGL